MIALPLITAIALLPLINKVRSRPLSLPRKNAIASSTIFLTTAIALFNS
ncbi:MAG: hypothetical protein GVY17_03015 [Cyanobacteria bacterium]|nr:hypothetical protein [Cyanobacteria bacterium GSL.Bin21]